LDTCGLRPHCSTFGVGINTNFALPTNKVFSSVFFIGIGIEIHSCIPRIFIIFILDRVAPYLYKCLQCKKSLCDIYLLFVAASNILENEARNIAFSFYLKIKDLLKWSIAIRHEVLFDYLCQGIHLSFLKFEATFCFRRIFNAPFKLREGSSESNERSSELQKGSSISRSTCQGLFVLVQVLYR